MPPPSKSVQGGDFIPPQGPFSESFSDSKILGFQRREGQKRAFVYCVLDLPTRICVPHLTFPPPQRKILRRAFFRPAGNEEKAFKNCPLAMREMAGRRRCGFAVGSWNGQRSSSIFQNFRRALHPFVYYFLRKISESKEDILDWKSGLKSSFCQKTFYSCFPHSSPFVT